MNLSVGMDIIEMKRFSDARFPARLADFILTPTEQRLMAESRDSLQYLASRFAAKEAVVKALPEAAGFLDFEILKQGNKPVTHMLAPALRRYTVSVSLSHSAAFAAACAVVLLG